MLTFGVSGLLWRENLVMYDSETGSWWAQASGVSIHGKLRGNVLSMYPASMMSWAEWRNLHPQTLVLTKKTQRGFAGMRPGYQEYHRSSRLGVTGRLRFTDKTLPPKALVVGFRIDDEPFAVELGKLKASGELTHTSRSDKRFQVVATPRGGGAQVFMLDSQTDARISQVPSSLSYWFAWKAFFPATRVIQP
jgi:hypothetical protein